MAIAERRRGRTPVPFAVETADRIPKQRYLDEEFHRLEAERLWSRVWQMACRLEEIPEPFDVVEYEIGDQSVVVVRTEDLGVRAFQNTCRHRGVRLVEGVGTCADGFTCPFHGWCYGPDGANTRIPGRKQFSAHNLTPGDVDLVPVRCETWGGCAWINLDADAPPLRESLDPAASILDAWKVESLRSEWWDACRLPVNWKLAIEAFVESYHVVQTHPQLVIPTRYGRRDGAPFDPRAFVDADIEYLRTMSDGMAGMVHADDVRVAEGLRDVDLPASPDAAIATWNRLLNDAVTTWHRERGADVPDLNDLAARGLDREFFQCFPHYFVLPMYSSASAYRFRPLGPEETLMEIWSLVRVPEDAPVARPVRPEVWSHDDPRWPPIPTQDFSNLPRQQRGLHSRGFEFMRLSEGLEGHISNFERTVDGYLAGWPSRDLLTAVGEVNVYPFDRPIVDLGIADG
jgi:phenylpropionate dioxygenase-like ring-hydroxylating dioxygenase large terminal subunit